MRGRLALVVLVVCCWHWALTTDAQATSENVTYGATIHAALVEYDAGRFAEARALFLRAHQMQPSARTLRGLGLVEYELGHYAAAISYLTRARSDSRHPLSDTQKQEIVSLLAYANAFVGRYRIERQPASAALTVDGEPVTLENLQEYVLDVGEHLLSVRAPGYRAQERRLDVKGQERETLRFELIREAEAMPSAALPPSSPRAAARAALVPTDDMGARRTDPEPPLFLRRTTWGWVSIGGAVLAFVGAGIAWRTGEAAVGRWNDDARCLRDGKTRQENCPDDQHTAEVARTWTTVGLIATGAFAATAVVLLWPTGGQAERRPEVRAFPCTPGPGQLGIACAVRF